MTPVTNAMHECVVSGSGASPAYQKHCIQDPEVWKRAPVLKGTTNFEPRHDVRNIMVTGGAGFM
jgi:hypothetical protein